MRLGPDEGRLRRQIVGRYFKDKRVAAGLTQWDVAKALQYSTAQFISNWERGVSLPPLESLPVLGELFGASSREIIAVMLKYEGEIVQLNKRRLTQLFKKPRST